MAITTKQERQQRRSEALQLIADGVSPTDAAMQLSQTWGCSRADRLCAVDESRCYVLFPDVVAQFDDASIDHDTPFQASAEISEAHLRVGMDSEAPRTPFFETSAGLGSGSVR